MTDIVFALHLLSNRINTKAPLNVYDIGIIEMAIQEINSLRKSHAILDAEIHKEKL